MKISKFPKVTGGTDDELVFYYGRRFQLFCFAGAMGGMANDADYIFGEFVSDNAWIEKHKKLLYYIENLEHGSVSIYPHEDRKRVGIAVWRWKFDIKTFRDLLEFENKILSHREDQIKIISNTVKDNRYFTPTNYPNEFAIPVSDDEPLPVDK